MSYGSSAALQAAIYQHLLDDPSVSAQVGPNVFDAVPAGTVPPVYISLGPEEVLSAGDKTSKGARHRFTVSVISENAGFQAAKTVAAAVSDALDDANPALSMGRVVRMQFQRAVARRIGNGTKRRIDLRFEARVEVD